MPTLKQTMLVGKVIETRGNTSKAMSSVGYSSISAHNPQQVTRSKGWLQLTEKYLPDLHLARKHREFLDSPKVVRTYRKGELLTEEEETSAQAVKALDLAYKIKGKYHDDQQQQTNIAIIISGSSAHKYGIASTEDSQVPPTTT